MKSIFCGLTFFLLSTLFVSIIASSEVANLPFSPSFPFEGQVLFIPPYLQEAGEPLTFFAEVTFFQDFRASYIQVLLDGKSVFEAGSKSSSSSSSSSSSVNGEMQFQAYRPWGVEIQTSSVGDHVLEWIVVNGGGEGEQDSFAAPMRLSRLFSIKNAKISFGSHRVEKPITMKRRTELGSFLNIHGLLGKGVEVGVKQGEFSEKILSKWKGEVLYLVDPWREQQDDFYVDVYGNQQQAIQDMFMEQTRARLSRFGDRFELIREFSLNATEEFEDESLDFIYLDAMHEYAPVKWDLEAWWPKLKIGGLFCGHDYKDGLLAHGNFGVISAVDEFAAKIGHEALFTMGKSYNWFPFDKVDDSPSWYFFKKHRGV